MAVIVSLFSAMLFVAVPGAFLAVLLLAIAKIVCDRVALLQPLRHILGS